MKKEISMGTTKRILVTGGAGLLGQHLCRRLLTCGYDVICLDNFFTSHEKNIADLRELANFQLIRHDVTQPIDLEVDEIYNLACPASPVHYQDNPVKTLQTSVVGSLNLLDLARRTGATILQASTSEVYGDPDVSPQPESYHGRVNPIGPRACYDEGKRCAETLFFDYQRMYGVPIRVVRIFNTYGPGQHPYDGRVVSNFIVQALGNEDITLYGDGLQTRSFCYVTDMIEGIVCMMENADGLAGPINLGNPNEITVRQLAEIVIELTGSKSAVVHRPLPMDDPTQRQPDITLAREKLRWSPGTDLRTGLKKTIDHFRRLDLGSYPPPTKNRVK
jgi:UDP-glucuronate decarboxylase